MKIYKKEYILFFYLFYCLQFFGCEISYLKLEDFNDTSTEDSHEYYRLNKSPIASHMFYSNYGENINLSYDVFKSKYKWAVEYNFTNKMEFLNEHNIRNIEKETELSKNIKVYMNEHGHEYTLVSENTMVEIYDIEGVSEEELMKTVYEKLFKEE